MVRQGRKRKMQIFERRADDEACWFGRNTSDPFSGGRNTRGDTDREKEEVTCVMLERTYKERERQA